MHKEAVDNIPLMIYLEMLNGNNFYNKHTGQSAQSNNNNRITHFIQKGNVCVRVSVKYKAEYNL